MYLSHLALLAAGFLFGTLTGAVVAWVRAIPSPLGVGALLGLFCGVFVAMVARAWLRSPRHVAFFLPAAAALPLGLLL